MLFTTGDHVPTILLFEVVGNSFNVAPEQIEAIWVNVGVVNGFTVTVVATEVEEQLLLLVTTTL